MMAAARVLPNTPYPLNVYKKIKDIVLFHVDIG